MGQTLGNFLEKRGTNKKVGEEKEENESSFPLRTPSIQFFTHKSTRSETPITWIKHNFDVNPKQDLKIQLSGGNFKTRPRPPDSRHKHVPIYGVLRSLGNYNTRPRPLRSRQKLAPISVCLFVCLFVCLYFHSPTLEQPALWRELQHTPAASSFAPQIRVWLLPPSGDVRLAPNMPASSQNLKNKMYEPKGKW